jgi:hypothetical protein
MRKEITTVLVEYALQYNGIIFAKEIVLDIWSK